MGGDIGEETCASSKDGGCVLHFEGCKDVGPEGLMIEEVRSRRLLNEELSRKSSSTLMDRLNGIGGKNVVVETKRTYCSAIGK